MIRLDAVRLIAWREIVTRVRARSFRIGVLIALAVVVGGIVMPDLLDSPPEPYRVVIVGELTEPELDAIRAAGSAVGREVEIADSADAARERRNLEAGAIDLLVEDGNLTVKRVPAADDTSTAARFLATVRGNLRIFAGLYESGLSPEAARTALDHPPPETSGVLPQREERNEQRAITMFGVIAIFVFVQQYGFWLVNGIIEEKASRVIEVLLAVARPNELLLGKTVGIGAVALGHGALLVTAALVAATATGSDILGQGGVGLIFGALGWFALAYVLYCLLMAMAGSLVARQEDAQNAAFPIMVPLLVAYMTSVSSIFADEPSSFVVALSFIPLTSPIAMPTRLASGGVPVLEVVVAIALVLAAIVIAARLASVVYARGALHTSGRLQWRDVLPGRAGRSR